MPVRRKNTSRKKTKMIPPAMVVVIKTFHSAEETHFSEKVRKAKEILTKAGFRHF